MRGLRQVSAQQSLVIISRSPAAPREAVVGSHFAGEKVEIQ